MDYSEEDLKKAICYYSTQYLGGVTEADLLLGVLIKAAKTPRLTLTEEQLDELLLVNECLNSLAGGDPECARHFRKAFPAVFGSGIYCKYCSKRIH